MSKIQAISMITVQTLKRKHLEQIRKISYERSVYKEICDDLIHEKPNRVVVGWVPGKVFGHNEHTATVYWLIHGPKDGEVSFMLAPDKKDYEGNPVPLWEKYKDVPQLFVD